MRAVPRTRVLAAGAAGAAAEAARVLAAGGLVAFPTETVYGLGADAGDGKAVARLYEAKGRPTFNPLIAHVTDFGAAGKLARFNADAAKLGGRFWPGPLTLVLPKASDCPVADLATAELDTVAVRVPDHGVARDILAAFGRPVVAPSANRSGHVSSSEAAHVLADLGGRIDLVIDGGPTKIGVESTIIACLDEAVMLRPGGLSRDAIEEALGRRLADVPAATGKAARPQAPGMLASHYAPRTRLRLDARHVEPGEILLAFGPAPVEGAGNATAAFNLSDRGDLVEAAANLFAALRMLDASGATAIAVAPVPHHGLGEAINDRLARAAAGR